jgi:NADP-dependent 3-hydroxy acid dehydrogenase YdfG
MKKVLVIGASGLLGSNIVEMLKGTYDVISSSLNDENYPVDISDENSIISLLSKVGKVDAIISTAGMVNFISWSQAKMTDWSFGLQNKLMGQINIMRLGREYVNDGGAIVLTTGLLAQQPIPNSSIVSTVNAGLEAAIASTKVELDGRVRIGAVSPGWISETMLAMGMDPEPGMPVAEVAHLFLDFIKHGENGQVVAAISTHTQLKKDKDLPGGMESSNFK